MLKAESSRPLVGAGLTVRDVLARYPATGPIFLQHGPMFTVRPGEPYPRYDALTIEEYAARNRIALDALLGLLNAAAEDEDQRPKGLKNHNARGPVIGGALGYTGSYRDPDPDLDLAPVVGVQTARGPE